MPLRFILIILIFLNGCAVFRDLTKKSEPEIYLTNNTKFQLFDSKIFTKTITFDQYFQGQFNENQFQLNTIIQISQDKTTITALTTFGIRLFTIEYVGKNINFRHSSFIKKGAIKPEYIVADVQLIYLPIEKIKKNIIGDILIEERKNGSGTERIFSSNNKVFLKIFYSKKDKFNSEISLQNSLRNYQYTIKNIKKPQ